ncbi:hypothetical protein [Sphingosinicella terrae]|uniref:hypothetical protein n=1 Tax=Sphingosinicella terrae TaxID=2172047 RepID=UPI000E0D57F2|nr:hypothetical protein [Sphingosinicella terrae]
MAVEKDERGERASFDRRTGEVHGSGSGAGGGGNPDEDYDGDPMAGGGLDPVSAPQGDDTAEGAQAVAGRARP